MKYENTLKQPERLDFIKNILYIDGKLNEKYADYFDGKFNSCPTMDQNLSDKDKICQELESMTNYILYSPDAPKIQKTRYNFYTQEKYNNKFGLDLSLNSMADKMCEDTTNDNLEMFEEVIDFLVRTNINYKKAKKQQILKDDLNDDDFATMIESQEYISFENILMGYQVYIDILRQYIYNDFECLKCGKLYKYGDAEKFLDSCFENRCKQLEKLEIDEWFKTKLRDIYCDFDNLSNEIKFLCPLCYSKNYKKIKINKRRAKYNVRQAKIDQTWLKSIIKKTIVFKSPMIDSTEIDYDQCDFLDKGHVSALLFNTNDNLQLDLGCLVQDLHNIINKMKFTENEEKVMNMVKNGWTLNNIVETINASKQYASSTLSKVSNKICKEYYKILEDWYYLNIVRGRYKKCSKCGEIKLATNSYFSPNKKGEYGFYSVCKVCDNFRNR